MVIIAISNTQTNMPVVIWDFNFMSLYLFSNSSLTFFKLNEQICKNISYPLKNVVHSNYISNVLSEINNLSFEVREQVFGGDNE